MGHFEELNASKRLKFLEIGGNLFVYNSKDSVLSKLNDSASQYDKSIKVDGYPVKTLILHSTYECNLRCNHCYMNAGASRDEEMDSQELTRIVREFGELGGLGVDISGGEPLLKKGIRNVIAEARNQRLRTVVLTNAVNLDVPLLREVKENIDGMAVGLDGLEDANDRIRGHGSFQKIKEGLKRISEEGIELSITTLLTDENISQLLSFPEFMKSYGVKSWSLVMPRPSGRFGGYESYIDSVYSSWGKAKENGILEKLDEETESVGISVVLDHVLVPEAKKRKDKSSDDFVYNLYNKGRACWDNTLTIMPNGDVKCCLFFDGMVYDNAKNKSLREIYNSHQRDRALNEFLKFPVEKCPFVEIENRKKFEEILD